MTDRERSKPDFSKALETQERIIASERFWYGGDPRGIGRDSLMRVRDNRRRLITMSPAESDDSGIVEGVADPANPLVARLISEMTEES